MAIRYGAKRVSDEAERRMWNEWIRDTPMSQMAERLDIPELPMRRPNFDFYTHAIHHLKQMNFVGQDLYDAAHTVIQKLFYNISKKAKSTEGKIYNYVKWYNKRIAQGFKPYPFDEYFKYAFRQMANTALREQIRQKEKSGLSIDYRGQGDDEGTVGEALLGDTGPGPAELFDKQEREENLREFSDMLAKDPRHGDKYVYVWELMREGYKLEEMADELNSIGVPSPSGGQWGIGSVSRVRNIINRMAKEFLEGRGFDSGSISSFRGGFRFGPGLK